MILDILKGEINAKYNKNQEEKEKSLRRRKRLTFKILTQLFKNLQNLLMKNKNK